jgi:hypothetical protein
MLLLIRDQHLNPILHHTLQRNLRRNQMHRFHRTYQLIKPQPFFTSPFLPKSKRKKLTRANSLNYIPKILLHIPQTCHIFAHQPIRIKRHRPSPKSQHSPLSPRFNHLACDLETDCYTSAFEYDIYPFFSIRNFPNNSKEIGLFP